ncbi:MAG: hypothetical protein JO133_12800 [Burkholderiaceae bacterium]|nr:hypothetical protein [Burkholderiaceae bacterium]
MNMNRRSCREDTLFVIALIVPAVFATARYFQSDHEMTRIAQAQAISVAAADHAPSQLVLAAAGERVGP